MASNRHLGRIVALQTLYEYELRSSIGDDVDVTEVTGRNLERYKEAIDDQSFVSALVQGVIDHATELDEVLQPLAPEWPIDQISRVDRTTLRLGLYELTYCADTVPPKVAINESVELAKAFGSDNSSRFINGVLGTAYRNLIEGKESNASAKV